MRSEPAHACHASGNRQRGVALIILLVLLLIGVGAAIFAFMRPASQSIERDKVTAAALAQAKAALIGFGIARDFSSVSNRPGDLPCPDGDNDGDADAVPACTGGALGRLPWKTLGLPDLRDGDGERLWYAVSSNFKNNPRTACTAPGQPGCLNSDSRGTITIRDSTGAVINDGSTASGVIAVVFSPGSVLRRQGAVSPQDRSCTVGVNCDAAEKCTASPPTTTPKCNPVNYLDVLSGVEDNSDFVDGVSTNGFINGKILDASNNIIVNDRLLTITYQDLVPLIERRVAKEVFNCLTAYAADLAHNNGHYPWAADIAASAGGDYGDVTNKRAGRIPDTFTNTISVSSGMLNGWTPSCKIPPAGGGWWFNWKELVFYALADAFKPIPGIPAGSPPAASACGGSGTCLTVNLPASIPPVIANQQVVVIVAGRMLGGQSRTPAEKGTPANYLESDNASAAVGPTYTDTFIKQPVGASFNDYVLFR